MLPLPLCLQPPSPLRTAASTPGRAERVSHCSGGRPSTPRTGQPFAYLHVVASGRIVGLVQALET